MSAPDLSALEDWAAMESQPSWPDSAESDLRSFPSEQIAIDGCEQLEAPTKTTVAIDPPARCVWYERLIEYYGRPSRIVPVIVERTPREWNSVYWDLADRRLTALKDLARYDNNVPAIGVCRELTRLLRHASFRSVSALQVMESLFVGRSARSPLEGWALEFGRRTVDCISHPHDALLPVEAWAQACLCFDGAETPLEHDYSTLHALMSAL